MAFVLCMVLDVLLVDASMLGWHSTGSDHEHQDEYGGVEQTDGWDPVQRTQRCGFLAATHVAGQAGVWGARGLRYVLPPLERVPSPSLARRLYFGSLAVESVRVRCRQ